MLTLYWSTEQTVQLPEGGDGVSQVFEELNLDILETDAHEGSTTYTSHSVEQGAPVVDHAEPQLARYSATVWVSKRRPRSGPASNPDFRDNPFTATGAGFRPLYDRDLPVETLETLNGLMHDATLVSVEGARIPIEDWVIESVSAPRTTSDAGALVANITFREWRVVEFEDTEAPAPTIERGRRGANRGTQTPEQTSDDTPSPAPANRASALEQARRALGGATGSGIRDFLLSR